MLTPLHKQRCKATSRSAEQLACTFEVKREGSSVKSLGREAQDVEEYRLAAMAPFLLTLDA